MSGVQTIDDGVHVMDDIMIHLADKFIAQKDELILGALPEPDRTYIKVAISAGLKPTALREHGQVLVSPKGVETFCWHGQPLIRFMPMELNVVANELIARQPYKLLAEDDSVGVEIESEAIAPETGN